MSYVIYSKEAVLWMERDNHGNRHRLCGEVGITHEYLPATLPRTRQRQALTLWRQVGKVGGTRPGQVVAGLYHVFSNDVSDLY